MSLAVHRRAEILWCSGREHAVDGDNSLGYRLAMIVKDRPEAYACAHFKTFDEVSFQIEPQLWPRRPGGVGLDGCGYEMSFYSGLSAAVSLGWWSPAAGSQEARWVDQLLRVATVLVEATKNAALAEYLTVWRTYVE